MTMKNHLIITLFLCGIFTSSNRAAEPERPNIVFILTDDMGRGDLSVCGGTQGETPNIDRLAREGTQFDQFYVASPICSPTRASFTTGMFPARASINTFLQRPQGNRLAGQDNWLDPKWPTLARTLKQAGYATAHFGKWHMGGGHEVEGAPEPSAYGYDEYHLNWEGVGPQFLSPGKDGEPVLNTEDGKKYHRWDFTKYWVDRSVDFIKRHKERPFYLELWPQDTHTPWVPSREALDRTAVPGLPQSQHNLRAVINEYDLQLGRLFDALRDMGVEKNTIVIFTADNGPDPSFDRARTLDQRGQKKVSTRGAPASRSSCAGRAKSPPAKSMKRPCFRAWTIFPPSARSQASSRPPPPPSTARI